MSFLSGSTFRFANAKYYIKSLCQFNSRPTKLVLSQRNYLYQLFGLPFSALKVLSRGDLLPGLHSLTVPSEEQDKSCILELCIESPHTASVCATSVSDNTLGSAKSNI